MLFRSINMLSAILNLHPSVGGDITIITIMRKEDET